MASAASRMRPNTRFTRAASKEGSEPGQSPARPGLGRVPSGEAQQGTPLLGVLFASLVGCWGTWAMVHGQRIFVLGLTRPLAPGAFYTLVSLLVILNAVAGLQGWRAAFICVGIIGVVVGILVAIFMKEPPRDPAPLPGVPTPGVCRKGSEPPPGPLLDPRNCEYELQSGCAGLGFTLVQRPQWY